MDQTKATNQREEASSTQSLPSKSPKVSFTVSTDCSRASFQLWAWSRVENPPCWCSVNAHAQDTFPFVVNVCVLGVLKFSLLMMVSCTHTVNLFMGNPDPIFDTIQPSRNFLGVCGISRLPITNHIQRCPQRRALLWQGKRGWDGGVDNTLITLFLAPQLLCFSALLLWPHAINTYSEWRHQVVFLLLIH